MDDKKMAVVGIGATGSVLAAALLTCPFKSGQGLGRPLFVTLCEMVFNEGMFLIADKT